MENLLLKKPRAQTALKKEQHYRRHNNTQLKEHSRKLAKMKQAFEAKWLEQMAQNTQPLQTHPFMTKRISSNGSGLFSVATAQEQLGMLRQVRRLPR